jgi:hypothetical protein
VARSLLGVGALLFASVVGPVVLAPASAAARPAMTQACPPPRPGHAGCLVLFQPQAAVNRAIAAGSTGLASNPKGWSPQAIESAYRLPVARNSHQTVAVSIAYGTPRLALYLAVYRTHYHLPPCTIGSGCLRIVNSTGRPRRCRAQARSLAGRWRRPWMCR